MMKIAVIVLLACLACVVSGDLFSDVVSRMEQQARGGNCNVWSCVGLGSACQSEDTCEDDNVACNNICQLPGTCYEGGTTNVCVREYVGRDCDDSDDCQGGNLDLNAPSLCGTNELCRFTDNGLVVNDYCCSDSNCESQTCVNGRCNPIALGGDCTEYPDDCHPTQYCHSSNLVCTNRIADGASTCGTNGALCLFGSTCIAGTCRRACSQASGASVCSEVSLGPASASTCVNGFACEAGTCNAVVTTGAGDDCSSAACELGQTCICNHNIGNFTCALVPSCCTQANAFIDCMRNNACSDDSGTQRESCLRGHCSGALTNYFSCHTELLAGYPSSCVSGSIGFLQDALAPNLDCCGAGAMNSWVSALLSLF